jgi:hypothetical protein
MRVCAWAAVSGGPGRDRTCDLGIKSPLLYQLSYRPACIEYRNALMDQARVSLMRWLRRQLRQPLPGREHLDPAEARRLLADAPFSREQRRYVDDVLDRWDREKAARG